MTDSSRQLNPDFPSEFPSPSPPDPTGSFSSDSLMSIGERTISAAGAAVISAIIVNPLDVAKTRLQAQAAGVPYHPTKNCIRGHMASRNTNLIFSDFKCSRDCFLTVESASPSECSRYKGTFDVLFKVARQAMRGCGGEQMQALRWLYQQWAYTYHVMTYSDTGLKNLLLKVLIWLHMRLLLLAQLHAH